MESNPVGETYLHYKGNKYKILTLARHSETEELLVIYMDLEDSAKVWVRPYNMFFEDVEISGKKIARFKKLDPR